MLKIENKSKMLNKKRGLERLAITEIFLLVIAVVAFSYAAGSSLPSVSAQSPGQCVSAQGSTWEFRSGETWDCFSGNCKQNAGSQIATTTGLCNSGEVECQDSNTNIVGSELFQCPTGNGEQNSPVTSATNIATSVGSSVTATQIAKLVEQYLNNPDDLTNEQKEAVAESLAKKGVNSELVEKIKNGAELSDTEQSVVQEATETGPGFLSRFLFEENLRNSIITGSVVIWVASIWTFAITLYKTGDPARAFEAAGRVAFGGAVGLGVYAALVAFTPLGPAGWIAAGIVAVGIWASQYLQRTSDRHIDFQCKPWQPVTGGEDCSLCNDQEFPCTEYQCKSLGSGCELVNKDTDEPRCIFQDPDDVTPPEIFPWENILEEGYRYEPLPAIRGVEIKYQNEECLPAFTPFTLGVELFETSEREDRENGYCRVDFERTDSFEEMQFDFGGSNRFVSQHSQVMSFPGVANIQDYIDSLGLDNESVVEINNDGEYEFYVRCMSPNGVSNREEFLFQFCIDKGPDTTAPVIREFNWNDESPIAHFLEEEERVVDVSLYVSEPSQCRWAHEDKEYSQMENNLSCSDTLINFNSQLSYTCSGELSGLQNNQENEFFFRCNDTFGNVNIQSETLTLIGTQPLHISEAGPNNVTIKDSTNSIKITLEAETNAGYEEGKSICEYSRTGESRDYVQFSNTDSFEHSTNIWLEEGDYQYFIRCIDNAGNSDTEQINFAVESDTQAPITVRVYKESEHLKIITNEPSSCVYSNFECNYLFEDGIEMETLEGEFGTEHFTDWNPNRNLYVKCADEFGNQPNPDQCNIIVRPFEL